MWKKTWGWLRCSAARDGRVSVWGELVWWLSDVDRNTLPPMGEIGMDEKKEKKDNK